MDREMRTVSAFTVRVELPLSRIRNHSAEPKAAHDQHQHCDHEDSHLECLCMLPSLL